jgi:hypothetical protein
MEDPRARPNIDTSASTESALHKFNDQLATHGDRLNEIIDKLISETSKDRSGLGNSIAEAIDDSANTMGMKLEEVHQIVELLKTAIPPHVPPVDEN